MSRYARMTGRKKYPGHRVRMVARRRLGLDELAKEFLAAPPSESILQKIETVAPLAEGTPRPGDKVLVAIGTKINGVVKSAISPEILAQTEGMPWHRRCARIAAITGKPFTEVTRLLDGSKIN